MWHSLQLSTPAIPVAAGGRRFGKILQHGIVIRLEHLLILAHVIEHPRRVLETLLVEIDQLETERGRLVVRVIADDGDVLPFLTDFHQQRLADVLRRVVAVFRPGRHDHLEFRELLGQRDRFVPLGVREQDEEFRAALF